MTLPPPNNVPPTSDQMICRACGKQERASEGYPCADCGTFICLLCNMRGVTLCTECQTKQAGRPAAGST